MAEQNRKTPEQILWRKKAEEVVDAFLDYIFADSDHDSITREGRSLLGIYSEHGEIPKGSGFSGFCKLAGKVDRMRLRHVTETMLLARRRMIGIEEDQVEAMCMDRMYRGKTRVVATDPLNGKTVEITYRAKDCAQMLGVSEEVFRKRVSRGYQQLESDLQSNKKAA